MAIPKPLYETALQHIDTSALTKANKQLSMQVHANYAFITLRINPEDVKAVAALAKLQITLPQPLATTGSEKRAPLLWLSPDEYLLRVQLRSQGSWMEKLTTALNTTCTAVVDSSGTYTMLELRGDKIIEALSKLVNYDLHNNFPTGKVISTLADAAPVILVRMDAQSIQVLVRFSYSAYFYQALEQSALEYL